MQLAEAKQILRLFNRWRNGENIPMPDQKLVSAAIDLLTA